MSDVADFDDALARAFAEIESAKKDKRGNFGTYSDLAAVTDAIKGPLTAEGFSWPQTIDMEDGMVVVTTRLRRKGVELCSVLPMPVGPKGGAHAVGSAITYARRYALSALVGVAPEDDDGQRAQDSGGGQARRPKGGQKSGPWRSSASADALASDKRARELLNQRAALIQELGGQVDGLEPDPSKAMGKILGLSMRGGYDTVARRLTPAQWNLLTGQLGAQVDALRVRATVEKKEDEANE